MRRSGRILSITTSALGVLALGFLVSIAANSVPGRGAEEPFLDVAWRPGVDVTTVLTWLVLIAAVMGAIIMTLSTRGARAPHEQKRRGIMVLVLGVIVFAVIARYMRSVADTILPETSELTGDVGAEPIVVGNGNAAWLFSLLVAAVVAVALTRVGLAIRSGAPPVQDLASDDDRTEMSVAASVTPSPAHGADPRGRILGAYGDFEQSVGQAGIPREPAETAARHAGRAGVALGLRKDDLSLLSGHHADARFGPDEPSKEDATEAESASTRLQRGIRK